MGKFNRNANVMSTGNTHNLAGGAAFALPPKEEIAHILLTSMLNGDQFYRKENDTLKRLYSLVGSLSEDDKIFAGKAAIYARDQFGMRSASHFLAATIGKTVKGANWTKPFFDKVCVRGDDPLEILSCYTGGSSDITSMPNSMKRGFGLFFSRQSGHTLAKYSRKNSGINMYDVIRVSHPKNSDALRKFLLEESGPAETWEVKLTQAGQKAETEEAKAELKKEAWAEMVKEKKLPYFATLRNLRNIMEAGDEETLDLALQTITNRNAIKRSRVFPFRFLTAYRLFSQMNHPNVGKVLSALATALDYSVENVPVFEGRTLVAIDTSGSMASVIAGRGQGALPTDTTVVDVAASLAAALIKRNPNCDVMHFATNAYYIGVNRNDSVISITEKILQHNKGGSTNSHAIFQKAEKQYDRIIVFSDQQDWVGYQTPEADFRNYTKKFDTPDTKVYEIFLVGYGTSPFGLNNCFRLAGWNDKMFDLMDMLDTDPSALVNAIENVVI